MLLIGMWISEFQEIKLDEKDYTADRNVDFRIPANLIKLIIRDEVSVNQTVVVWSKKKTKNKFVQYTYKCSVIYKTV